MALICLNESKRLEKERNTIHVKAEATYTVFKNESGEKLFQIDTYGSNDRKNKGKISQSIQLDKSCAKELVKLLKTTFDI
ncbi:hypothetical protein PU629_13295 [Pullulanibacillus sp. KACC 23026]|uniref:hypothetical protein n=1 Tax=Pullulanibacillus sp. KACC 23026 TaxID=3028315 RepID=UPI0023B011C2|nr:hypothetical protein [Pullulanibacillus sp. KACC 23026]WEG11144.1 hypothetical protein PU629_13295 [Pullulanibacillus sp. KACC 23026]